MSIQNEEIAEIWKKEKLAWDSMDSDRILEARLGSRGYGFRNITWREYPPEGISKMKQAIDQYFSNMEYFRHVDMDVNTWSEGDLGLAWGFFTEEFQHKGQPPETVRVRFSCTYRREDREWRLVMSHHDIQPFNEEGFYLKNLTRIE